MITIELDQEIAPMRERLPMALVASLETRINERASEKGSGTIAVRYVTDEEIQLLNKDYRAKDEVTDVLAFSYKEGRQVEEETLGDVVISVAQAKRQMKDRDIQSELAMLIVHGVLHVLGYDHEEPNQAEEMFSLQDDVLDQKAI